MSGSEHYEAVLKDLEEEQAETESELEELAAQHQAIIERQQELNYLVERLRQRLAARSGAGPYAGLAIIEAAAAFLADRGESAATQEITDKIMAGGVESRAANPKTTVYGVLHRDDKNEGVIMKTGAGKWGLREWDVQTSPDAAPVSAAEAAEEFVSAAEALEAAEREAAQVQSPGHGGLVL